MISMPFFTRAKVTVFQLCHVSEIVWDHENGGKDGAKAGGEKKVWRLILPRNSIFINN